MGRSLIELSFQVSFMIVLVIAVVLIGVSACQPVLSEPQNTTPMGMEYEYFEIEGMPCFWVGAASGGPSCDWSKWQGEKR